MRVRAVVFDLDGTLIDGYAAIGEALTYACRGLGVTPPSGQALREMVGLGLEVLLERAVGKERSREGVALFRRRYPDVAVAGSHLLPGAESVVRRLASEGYVLALASNKPPEFSRKILEARGLASFFCAIGGPDSTHAPKPDPAIARTLMAAMMSVPEETVCVGDMEVDVQFAHGAGCRAIVMPTGSREREFLENSEPDLLIDDLSQLSDALRRLD